jgi:integrative and conjugative element protein (TIGR02256 family)
VGIAINKIIYDRAVLEFFAGQLKEYGSAVETGGVLLGYRNDNFINVLKASLPGPKAIHEYQYFQADPDYVDMVIDEEYANSEGKIVYLGEWHTHPQLIPKPSPKDLQSLDEIAESKGDFCIMLIIGSLEFSLENFHSKSITILSSNC